MSLEVKKVIKEFDKRATERDGIVTVLSDRFGLELNEEFNETCKNLIKKYLPRKLKNVADVGIGIGRLAKLFSPKSERLLGIDFSNKMLAVANKYLGDQKNVALIYNDAIDIDFLPQYFDLGIVSLVLKHNNNRRAIKIIKKLKKWCEHVLLIEHVSGGIPGSDIAIIRKESWYIDQFKPMKPVVLEKIQRGRDNMMFCIFK